MPTSPLRLLAVALLAPCWTGCGCNEGRGDTAAIQPDLDQDGFGADQDCNDDDASIHPDAVEVCDGIDNDCDGFKDDEDPDLQADTWYADDDEDRFGDPDKALVACEKPTGYTDNDQDCDDSDDAIAPDELEYCDGVDNDCDGETDEDDAEYTSTFYQDLDGDGYGTDAQTTQACDTPSGYADNDEDCDDEDASVYPGAPESMDGLDQDCDEYVDEYELSLASATLLGESASDKAGRWLAPAGDMDGDGRDDLLAGAIGDDQAGTDAGAVYLVLSPVKGPFSLSAADAKLLGEDAGDQAGYGFAGGRDLDDDGLADLLVGAPYCDAGDPDAGAAYLLSGASLVGEQSLTDAQARLLGQYDSDYAGWSVALPGDLTADGQEDLLVGAPLQKEGSALPGAVYLVPGPVQGDLELSETIRLVGETSLDGAGVRVVGPGDVDGDGQADLLVGANGQDSGGSSSGSAYLLLGPVTADLPLAEADAKRWGESANDMASYGLAGAGDVNADGYADLLVGAPYDDSGGNDAGAAYLLLGPIEGSESLANSPAKLLGQISHDNAGGAVAGAGDVDGDGWADVLVGSPDYQAHSDSGSAALLLGPLEGEIVLDEADALLLGEAALDYAGYAVAGAGDLDADGLDDLLVGAPLADGMGSDAGMIYLLYGGW